MKVKHPPFIMLPHAVFDSDEFRALSPLAKVILMLMIRRHNGHNNGSIMLGSREAADWFQCDQSTAWRAMSELKRSGIVTVTDKGRLVRGGANRATRWQLNFICGQARENPKERKR